MKTNEEAIERVTITGRIEDRDKARQYCTQNGFKIVHDTPMIISQARVDANSFKIVAEKPKHR